MIVEITSISKENIKNLNKDQYPKYPNLLGIANSIIDWPNSKFPTLSKIVGNQVDKDAKIESVERRDLLGEVPELQVGWAFNYLGQSLIFLDNDTLCILDTESGMFGLVRAISHIISEYKIKKGLSYIPEFKANFGKSQNVINLSEVWNDVDILSKDDVTYSEVPLTELKSNEELTQITFPIAIKDIVSELCGEERINLKVTSSSFLFLPTVIQINPYFGKVFYSEEEILDESIAKSIALTYVHRLSNKEKENNSI